MSPSTSIFKGTGLGGGNWVQILALSLAALVLSPMSKTNPDNTGESRLLPAPAHLILRSAM